MTSQSPRIYLYKITFEEVPYYYYGVHKEKYFNEDYCGSPVTHKWCWELYTPKKQILQLFQFSDEGWIEAQEVETRLIRPVYNTDKWCLNESCGGKVSLSIRRKTGKRIGKRNRELGLGIFTLTKEQMSENGKKIAHNNMKNKTAIFAQTTEERRENGKKAAEVNRKNGTGLFGLSAEQRSENGKKVSAKNKENKVGIFALTTEQLVENAKKGGAISSKIINAQRWECCITGYVSTAAGVVSYQKGKGIDTSKSNRRRIA
jgi:hypothetical protein